jgi:hypothetical protein
MAYPELSLRLELQQVPRELHEHTYDEHSPRMPFSEDSEWVQCDECLDWTLIPAQHENGGVQ